MYATRSRRVKSDKRDARTLCEACERGTYRAIHRATDAQRPIRAELAVRDALVRSEYSSGERQLRGRITKRGNKRTRWLLVEAAWRVLRSNDPEAASLRAWAERIALRRGRRIAVVALARRLAGILFAIWRDGTAYRVQRKEIAA